MSIYTPILQRNPRVKPLAQALIAAAAEQGASLEELKIACNLAVQAVMEAGESSSPTAVLLKSKAEAALKRI